MTCPLTMKPPVGLGSKWLDIGQGGEAEKLRRLEPFSEHSILLDQRYLALTEAYLEALEDNWDGYGAIAPTKETYDVACSFLNYLPSSVPDPDVEIDPDGEVSFDWYIRPRMTFSVSVGPTGRLSYAGLYGRSTTYGTESIIEGLPAAILGNIGRLYSQG